MSDIQVGQSQQHIFIQCLYIDISPEQIQEVKKQQGISITKGVNEPDPMEHDHSC